MSCGAPTGAEGNAAAHFPERLWNLNFVDHIRGHGDEVYQHCCMLQMEGIVSKRADSTYHPGARSASWLKVKNPNYRLVRTGNTELWDMKRKKAA